MFTEQELAQIITDIVPHWGYDLRGKSKVIKIKIGGNVHEIRAVIGTTTEMNAWVKKIEPILVNILGKPSSGSQVFDHRIVEEIFVAEWLKVKGYESNWQALFDYNKNLDNRTYENSSIGFTFIVDSQHTGDLSLVDGQSQKLLDILAETNYTYFTVGNDWSYLDYNYINWAKIEQPPKYTGLPSFLFPYQCILSEGQCAVTRTKRSDLIIYNKQGLLAAYRKGYWKLYEITSLKNSIIEVAGNHWLGANLLDILFDLSYRRHGALIIVDRGKNYANYISNSSSSITNSNGSLHSTLAPRLNTICLNRQKDEDISKPLVLELASIDGALVLDREGKIISFGSMIKSHEKSNNELGARSSAALSAYFYGALPFKVSSDGEIVALVNTGGGAWEDGVYVPSGIPTKVTFF